MKFTKRFNEALKNSGKSQAELAAYTGVSRQLITEFKKGRAYPSLEIFLRYASSSMKAQTISLDSKKKTEQNTTDLSTTSTTPGT